MSTLPRRAIRRPAVLTAAPRSAGVVELVDTWLAREASRPDAYLARHVVPIGAILETGAEVMLRPDRGSVLITGTSGGG